MDAITAAQEETPFEHLEYRNVGPVNMSGGVTDVEGVAGDPAFVYVGSASGGVWKTEDGGVIFRPVFDEMPIASIGDLAPAPSNPEVIYVGTGESNTRNSVSFGNGVYKSTDGGKTWTHLGLADTRHISRIAVHPQNPEIVFVGALGNWARRLRTATTSSISLAPAWPMRSPPPVWRRSRRPRTCSCLEREAGHGLTAGHNRPGATSKVPSRCALSGGEPELTELVGPRAPYLIRLASNTPLGW